MLIALVGFAITIWNVRASKAASLRAEDAARRAQRAIRFFDAVSDVSTAIAAMEEIRRLHRDGAWAILPDRYSALRKSLNAIRRTNPGLGAEQLTLIQAAVRYLGATETKVERSLEREEPLGETARWNVEASRHVMELHELLLDLK